jgi:hypothetical protein
MGCVLPMSKRFITRDSATGMPAALAMILACFLSMASAEASTPECV